MNVWLKCRLVNFPVSSKTIAIGWCPVSQISRSNGSIISRKKPHYSNRIIFFLIYSDSSVVTLLLDRRLILPTRAPINNLQEAEMKTYWRDSNTPHHIFKEPHIEKLRIVHKFDSAGKIVQWLWHYEDNDISELPISSPVGKGLLYTKIKSNYFIAYE